MLAASLWLAGDKDSYSNALTTASGYQVCKDQPFYFILFSRASAAFNSLPHWPLLMRKCHFKGLKWKYKELLLHETMNEPRRCEIQYIQTHIHTNTHSLRIPMNISASNYPSWCGHRSSEVICGVRKISDFFSGVHLDTLTTTQWK